MTTFKTLTDLTVQTLKELGVLPDGQTPQIEDTAAISGDIPALLEELAGREIVFVPDLDNIPGPWFMSIAKILAYELRNGYGIVGDEAASLKQGNDDAILKLKIMLRGRPTGEALRTLYF